MDLEQSREFEGGTLFLDAVATRRVLPDEIARRPATGETARHDEEETIVIELVNASSSSSERDARNNFLTALFADEKDWKLDIRYIDNPSIVEERATLGVERSWGNSEEIVLDNRSRLLKDLKTRKRIVGKAASAAPEYLRIWAYLTQTLRFWERSHNRQRNLEAPLSAVWLAFIEGPGHRIQEKGRQPDFPQFEDYAQIALQGGILDKEVVAQLWSFYLAVHRVVSSARFG